MRAHLISIGSELLLGDILDTNSSWISKQLNESGIDVYHHETIGDNHERMVEAVKRALEDSDIVITTGGLGPTQDDITREAIAEVFGEELTLDAALEQEIRDYFLERGYSDMPKSNLQQAMIFPSAKRLDRVGSAPSFVATKDNKQFVFCLPGVPFEMKPMVTRSLIPYLQDKGLVSGVVTSRFVRCGFLSEALAAELLADLHADLEREGEVTLAFLAAGGEVKIRLSAKAETKEKALEKIDEPLQKVVSILDEYIVGFDDSPVEFSVAKKMESSGLSVAIAESITAGGVGARLVKVPGASQWFLGGSIVYDTKMKSVLAGVDPQIIEEFGPASKESAQALASGIRSVCGSNIGVGVVGIAGPTTQGDEVLGAVHICIDFEGDIHIVSKKVPSINREEIQEFAATYTLNALYDVLKGQGI